LFPQPPQLSLSVSICTQLEPQTCSLPGQTHSLKRHTKPGAHGGAQPPVVEPELDPELEPPVLPPVVPLLDPAPPELAADVPAELVEDVPPLV
jgi:hypothetical protein